MLQKQTYENPKQLLIHWQVHRTPIIWFHKKALLADVELNATFVNY